MQDSSVQPDSRSLVEQALHHIQLLSDILDQFVDSNESRKSLNSKKEQLADLTKIIKQWEVRKLPVTDEFRAMKTNLRAEVDYVDYKVTSLERIRKGLKKALSKITFEEQILDKSAINLKVPTNRSHLRLRHSRQYRDLIITTLRYLGGSAPTLLIKEEIEKKLRGQLTETDLVCDSSGRQMWWRSAQSERALMVNEGLLSSSSPNGPFGYSN